MQTPIPTDSHETPAATPMLPPNHRLLFALIIVLFFLWGMSNNLTDILVQQFKKSLSCRSSVHSLYRRRTFSATSAWLFLQPSSCAAGGYKTGMIVGLCTFGLGMILFWPAAITGLYIPFLIALFVVGSGCFDS